MHRIPRKVRFFSKNFTLNLGVRQSPQIPRRAITRISEGFGALNKWLERSQGHYRTWFEAFYAQNTPASSNFGQIATRNLENETMSTQNSLRDNQVSEALHAPTICLEHQNGALWDMIRSFLYSEYPHKFELGPNWTRNPENESIFLRHNQIFFATQNFGSIALVCMIS